MNFDSQLFLWIYHLHGHSAFLDWLMINIAQDGLYLYALFLLAMWFVGRDKEAVLHRREAALSALAAGILGLLLNVVIAHIWFRPRPFVTLHVTPLFPHSADASFPSDHTTGSMGLAGGAALRNRKIGLFFGIFSVAIGFARVYTGVHYPTDILGAFGVGLFSTAVIAWAKRPMNWAIGHGIGLWTGIGNRFRRA